MDSKYSIFSKSKPTSVASSPFGQNLKRKFSYMNSSSSAPPAAKKPHNSQLPSKHSNAQFKNNSTKNDCSSSGNRNHSQDIQMQRKQLPVFAVREK